MMEDIPLDRCRNCKNLFEEHYHWEVYADSGVPPYCSLLSHNWDRYEQMTPMELSEWIEDENNRRTI